MPVPPRIARGLARMLRGEKAVERAKRLSFRDLGHGYCADDALLYEEECQDLADSLYDSGKHQ